MLRCCRRKHSGKKEGVSAPMTQFQRKEDILYPATPRLVSKIGTSCAGLFDMSSNSSFLNSPRRLLKVGVGLDIVALHTLGGTALGSWYPSRPSNMAPRRPANPSDIPLSKPCTWLRNLLQPDFAAAGARVLAYGYVTDPGTGGVKTTRLANSTDMHVLDIDCIAEDLLSNIIEARARSLPFSVLGQPEGLGQQRPLIFIAHGLGGLVLKKAILLCRAAPEGSDRRKVLMALAHVIFLSTPHDGGDQRLPARWSDVVFVSGVDVAIPSREWAVVTKEFQALGGMQDVNFTVSNVIETEGVVSAFGTAVFTITTDDVACLGWGNDRERVFKVERRNHLSIPDISGPQGPVYRFIQDSIREVIDRMRLADGVGFDNSKYHELGY